MARISIDDTKDTHSYLLLGEEQPQCIGCNGSFTVRHFHQPGVNKFAVLVKHTNPNESDLELLQPQPKPGAKRKRQYNKATQVSKNKDTLPSPSSPTK